jgi:2-polyprenyl-3-methyl-5-hydroxy-6-metoxy-1,4-benzoquinol methylase
MTNIQDVKAYYDKQALDPKKYFRGKNPRVVKLLKFIDTLAETYKFKSALDLGCNVGVTSEYLRTHTKKVVAIDLSSVAIATAKERNLYGDIEYIAGDFTFMNLDRKFDIICAFDVLEHILPESLPTFVENMRLHCGGIVAISVPNPDHIKKLRETNPGILQIIDEEIRDSAFSNFTVISKKVVDVYLYYILKPKL